MGKKEGLKSKTKYSILILGFQKKKEIDRDVKVRASIVKLAI